MDTKVNDILERVQRQFDQLQKNIGTVYIVNAGRMNHGKSSLFNSLLDREAFAVNDIRTTVACKEEMYAKGVFFVDTPGLDALEKDDGVAFEAYKKANMIIFVHTPKVGEFHKDELQQLKRIRDLFPQKDMFWKHFCLVLTFKEAVDNQELKNIQDKILEDIRNNCGGSSFSVFSVSNSRYIKGKLENKDALIMHSGIPELKQYIRENITAIQKDSYQVAMQRWEKARKEACQKLTKIGQEAQNRINVKEQQYQNKLQNIQQILERAKKSINGDMNRISNISEQIEVIKKEKIHLEQQWKREKY